MKIIYLKVIFKLIKLIRFCCVNVRNHKQSINTMFIPTLALYIN